MCAEKFWQVAEVIRSFWKEAVERLQSFVLGAVVTWGSF